MDIVWEKGLLLSNGCSIGIDCNSADFSILTHAHADHIFSSHNNVLASEETFALLKNKNHEFSKGKALKLRDRVNLDLFEISLHNSGHILGSAQVFVDGSKRIAITSDFKLQDSLVTTRAEILECDTLIIETTFGMPEYVFPEREKLYEELASYAKRMLSQGNFLILAGYAVGKAQELTAFVNEYLGIAPIVHESIYKNNQIYEAYGIKLGTYYELNHNLHESNVLILPPSLCSTHLFQAIEYSLSKKVSSAKVSGWPYRGCFDKVFPLSDHADFNQLLTYVKECGAKEVLTFHGYSREFARYIKHKFGLNARELDQDTNQKILWDYEK
ncbi:MAG: MBL fold metallo-hydrolase [Candidatus Diapherotrites archaeon]